jgi:hypothetical protein
VTATQAEPEFPVDLVGATELHATFREESRTSLFPASAVLEGNWGISSSWTGKTPY